jgi:hypothetical protein
VAFTIRHRGGDEEDGSGTAGIDTILAELDEPRDDEHPDVAVGHESGWTLSAFQTGSLVWENPETDDEPRHLKDVSRAEARRIMVLVAEGGLDEVDRLDWSPGYGS